MALDSSYRKATTSFWANRALRIYPTYLFVAAIALAFRLVTDPGFLTGLAALPGGAQLLLWASNAALFGQDWVMFLGVNAGQLTPVTDFKNSQPELWTFLLVPPAWSLGVELSFYLLAPFLLRLRTNALIAIIVGCLLVRVVLAFAGLYKDPWNYRFFPNELGLFLIGSVACRVMNWWRVARPTDFSFGRAAVWCVAAFIAVYVVVPMPEIIKRSVLLVSVAAALPLIFHHSKNSKLDRLVGDLSYPLYISHWLALEVLTYNFGTPSSLQAALLYFGACVAAAVALCVAIDVPMQSLRARIRSGGSTARSPVLAPTSK